MSKHGGDHNNFTIVAVLASVTVLIGIAAALVFTMNADDYNNKAPMVNTIIGMIVTVVPIMLGILKLNSIVKETPKMVQEQIKEALTDETIPIAKIEHEEEDNGR